jgi:plasmid stabilization system protein ParE
MRVRFTETALAEIEQIHSYIAADNPAAADIVRSQIEHTVALIGTLPRMGRIKYRRVVRMLPVRRYQQYLVFYVIEANEVVILNVRHGARRSPWEA